MKPRTTGLAAGRRLDPAESPLRRRARPLRAARAALRGRRAREKARALQARNRSSSGREQLAHARGRRETNFLWTLWRGEPISGAWRVARVEGNRPCSDSAQCFCTLDGPALSLRIFSDVFHCFPGFFFFALFSSLFLFENVFLTFRLGRSRERHPRLV